MELQWLANDAKNILKYLNQVPHRNWLQDIPYLEARRCIDHRQVKWAIINEVPSMQRVALCAFEEIRLGAIHIIELQLGPLWFEEGPGLAAHLRFAELFAQVFPRRLFRRRRWLPNWQGSVEDFFAFETKLFEMGFQKTKQTFVTTKVNLGGNEDLWISAMKPKWRQGLKKAQAFALQISVDEKGRTTDAFVRGYHRHLLEKKYWGLSPRFLAAEIGASVGQRGSAGQDKSGHLILWAAPAQGVPLAAVLLGIHGQTASYRAGWSTQEGRAHQATYLLLFEGMRFLKRMGVREFDLGGLLPGQADGLTHFKRGLGGVETLPISVYK